MQKNGSNREKPKKNPTSAKITHIMFMLLHNKFERKIDELVRERESGSKTHACATFRRGNKEKFV